MEIQDGLKLLANKYSAYDWYDSVGLDRYGRYVVYVTTMNFDVMNTVQQSLERKQVLISYANSKPENVKNYITEYKASPVATPAVAEEEVDILSELSDEDIIVDVEELIANLDRMEKICGSHGLQDIFYEIHDGKNAVTNLGAKYPDVKRDMKRLYDRYGFDIIYEELDG